MIYTKNLKKYLSVLLIFGMLVSLAACKGSDDIVAPDEGNQNTPVVHVDPETGEIIEFVNSDLAKVGVYDVTDIDLGFDRETSYIMGSGKTDDGAYFIVCQNDDNYNTAYYLFNVDDEGNLLKKTVLSKPVDNIIYDGNSSDVLEANENAPGIRFDNVMQLLAENNISVNYIDAVYYENFNYAGDGKYEAILRIYTGSYDETSTEYVFDVRWNEEGECTDLIHIPLDYGDGYVDKYVFSPDGKLSILYNYYRWDDDIYGERAVVLSENRFEDSKNMIVAENEDLSTWLCQLGSFVSSGDKLIAFYASVEDPYAVTASEIDLDTFEPVDPYTLDQLGSGSSSPLGTTDDERFVFYTNSGLQVCKKGEKAEVLFDYINSDFRQQGCNNFVSIDGTDKFYISYYDENGGPYLAFCKHVAPEDVPDCNVVTVGSCALYDSLLDLMLDYNSKNTGTRIVYKDYQFYESYTDYNADVSKMYEDMLNGRMTDIVFLDSYDYMDTDTLSRKGILADIGSLIEEDPEMSIDDYLPNVIEAISYNGTLYRLVPSFSVNTVYGSSEFLSGYENWNVDTFLEYAGELDPEEAIPFSMFEIRENFLADMLRFNGYTWIDRDGYSCDFNDPSFGRLIGYAKDIPLEMDFESVHMQHYWEGSDSMIATGEIRTDFCYMTSYKDAYFDTYSSCLGDATFVGFPSPVSQGSVLCNMDNYFIKADTIMIKEAWDFVKTVLGYDYQTSDNIYNFPVLNDAFEVRMEDCAKPYISIDESGEKYEYIPSYYIDGIEYETPLMTEEQIKAAEEFIYSINREQFVDPDLDNLIISEINQGYENGDTPEEIASSIQLSVQNYLDEKKAR